MTREKINAELAFDTTAEMKETGNVTSPNITPSIDTAILKRQLELLQQQFAQLIEQQKVQTQQTNNTLSQIQQNTAPTPVVAPSPTSASIPTSLKVEFANNTYPEFVGANCEAVRANVAVLNQFGGKNGRTNSYDDNPKRFSRN
jgi:type II secretory pathway pseudopilin PulG